jgi:ankyrin repeat protein
VPYGFDGSIEILSLLLDVGEDPNRYSPKQNPSNSTPLPQAVWSGHMEIVRLLVLAACALISKTRSGTEPRSAGPSMAGARRLPSSCAPSKATNEPYGSTARLDEQGTGTLVEFRCRNKLRGTPV